MGPTESTAQMEEKLKESEMILAENVVTKLQLKIEDEIEKHRQRQIQRVTTSSLITEKVLQSVTTQITDPEIEKRKRYCKNRLNKN